MHEDSCTVNIAMHLDDKSCSSAELTLVDNDYPQAFSDALVSEIKAEMGRRDLSSRGLGRLIGKSSQYMSDRLDGGNTRTGRRVTLNITDVLLIDKHSRSTQPTSSPALKTQPTPPPTTSSEAASAPMSEPHRR